MMIYILLADGFEETEMVAPWDMLLRAGLPVKTVGVTGKSVKGSHGLVVEADLLPEEVDPQKATAVILPGGMPGTTHLMESPFVLSLLRETAKEGKLLAAICAAPMILGELQLLCGKKAVCFPGFEDHLHGAIPSSAPVVQDGNIITAKGAGAALLFGAALADALKGEGTGADLLRQMQSPYEG